MDFTNSDKLSEAVNNLTEITETQDAMIVLDEQGKPIPSIQTEYTITRPNGKKVTCGLRVLKHHGKVMMVISRLAQNDANNNGELFVSEMATHIYKNEYPTLSPADFIIVEHDGISQDEDMSDMDLDIFAGFDVDSFEHVPMEWFSGGDCFVAKPPSVIAFRSLGRLFFVG